MLCRRTKTWRQLIRTWDSGRPHLGKKSSNRVLSFPWGPAWAAVPKYLEFASSGKAEKPRWVNSLNPQKPEKVVNNTDKFSQDLCRSCYPKDPRHA